MEFEGSSSSKRQNDQLKTSLGRWKDPARRVSVSLASSKAASGKELGSDRTAVAAGIGK